MKKPKAIPLKEVRPHYTPVGVDAEVTVLDTTIKEPNGPCDLSYGNKQYWFGAMKRLNAHNIREKTTRIMCPCPRTGLIMTMKGQDIQYKDHKGDLIWGCHPEGWEYEDNEVQLAYDRWKVANVAERFLLGDD